MSEYFGDKCPRCGTELEKVVLKAEPSIHVKICPKCLLEFNGIKDDPDKHKPPLGCSPYYVNISARICELCEAIKRYATESENKYRNIRMWAIEILLLAEADRRLRQEEKQKVWIEDEKGFLHEDH